MTTDALYYLCVFRDCHRCNGWRTKQAITRDVLHRCIVNSYNLSQSLLSVHVYLCDFLLVFWVAAVHHYKFGCTQVLTKVVSLDHLAFESGTTA